MEKYRIRPATGMGFGLYSLGDHIPNPITGKHVSAEHYRVANLNEGGNSANDNL
ncbi:hypothetical protein [Sporosarcina koreensis]|uniref:Uncharacterized protein n=1 Tax=Sporosarcina koreensis TaxID=334735 RepID=A0ABW0U0P5_9BACL